MRGLIVLGSLLAGAILTTASGAAAQVRLIVESSVPEIRPDALRASLAERMGVEVVGLEAHRAVQVEMMVGVSEDGAAVSVRSAAVPRGSVIHIRPDESLVERLAELATVPIPRGRPSLLAWEGGRTSTLPILRAWPVAPAAYGPLNVESGLALSRPPPSS